MCNLYVYFIHIFVIVPYVLFILINKVLKYGRGSPSPCGGGAGDLDVPHVARFVLLVAIFL